ncbi:MAG: metallophosphoesterase [Nanoarchaeota archaeon]|nr:metallophosphoesterase [Nanoarchaeota archaeon]
MDPKEILGFCMQKGLLIDKEVLNLFSGTVDTESVKLIIEKIKIHTNQRIITKSVFYNNQNQVEEFFSNIPEEKIKRLKIKLGLSIEISQEIKKPFQEVYEIQNETSEGIVKLNSLMPSLGRKLVVKDFITHFRNRFFELKSFLQERPELNNLISINKIVGNRQGISIIGMIYGKKITKNKNIILEVEDLTGKINVLINQNKKEVYEKALDLSLDSVVGFKASGNREILFANDLFLPELNLPERKKSPFDESVVFISDIHIGSKLFFEKNFLKFIDYLNGKLPNTPEAKKIKYLFVVGDLVAGVGVYPGQERELAIPDIEGQYTRVAELFGKIRKDIQIIILPGNHDCVRLMEPQPVLDEKYAWPLYNMENVTLTANPSTVNVGARGNFSGFDVLSYHGFSYFFYGNNVPSLIEQNAAIDSPDKIMTYLLQNRHLSPTHSFVQHFPDEKDPLLIRKAPDIFVSGHTHKGAASYYNNILILSSTCWESLTLIQEKYGSKPDFCKVPMFNFKTRELKILDFYESDEEVGG